MNNIDQIISQLTNEIKKAAPEQMWTVNDIATFMNMSTKVLRNNILVLEDFPDPISIPYGGGKRTQPRWYPQEIKQWISKHRVKH